MVNISSIFVAFLENTSFINPQMVSCLNIVKCEHQMPSLKSILNVLTVHSLTLIFVVICVLWQAVFSRKKYRFEIAHKTCSHWLMTLKTLDGFCHAIKHFFNENCKKGKFPYRLFCCKIMTKTTVQSLLPDSTFEFKFSWSKAVSYWMSSLSKWKSKF